jgi:hypothetical protein
LVGSSGIDSSDHHWDILIIETGRTDEPAYASDARRKCFDDPMMIQCPNDQMCQSMHTSSIIDD